MSRIMELVEEYGDLMRAHAITPHREYDEEAADKLSELRAIVGEMERDASLWRKWFKWILCVNKKPMGLHKDCAEYEALAQQSPK